MPDGQPNSGTTISRSDTAPWKITDIVEHDQLMERAAAEAHTPDGLTVNVYDALVSVRARLGYEPLPVFDEFAHALLDQAEARARARAGGPTQTFIANDGTVTHGAAAIKAFETHLAWTVKRCSGRTTGRAPREGRNERRRGSRRGARATSSSSDDPDPDPPVEPSPQRLCQLPGCDKPAKRKYCSTQHAATDRQRRHRAKQRRPGRLLRFSDRLMVEDGFDRHQRDPYKLFDTELWRGPGEPPRIVTYEDLKARAEEGCRCNGANGHRLAGHHRADQADETCFWCGHWCYGAGPHRPPAPFYAFLRKLVSA